MNPIGLTSHTWRIEGFNYFINDPECAIAICGQCSKCSNVNVIEFAEGKVNPCYCQKKLPEQEMIFGKWKILEEVAPRKSKRHFICECECGNVKIVDYYNLKKGFTTSCGKCKVSKKLTKKEIEEEKQKEYLEQRKQETFKGFRELVQRNINNEDALKLYREQGLIDENNEIIEAGFEVPQAIIEPRE